MEVILSIQDDDVILLLNPGMIISNCQLGRRK